MEYQTSLTQGQPDDEAVRLLQYYEALALENDPRGYCVCTSEGKDSRVLGHLFRRAGVKHFYQHSITGIDPPELIYFQRSNFQQYRDAGYLTYDVMYRKSMWQLMLEKKIPPLRTIRYCCAELKEKRSEHQGKAVVSFGVRKYESVKRARSRNELEIALPRQKNLIMPFDDGENRKIFELCYRDREKRVNPLAYWTDADIWNGGNTFTLRTEVSNLDYLAPEAEYSVTPDIWTNGPAAIHVTATDPEPEDGYAPSGVKSITLPDGTVVDGDAADFTVSVNGTYDFIITDNGGNTATLHAEVGNVDTARPTVDFHFEPLDGGDRTIIMEYGKTEYYNYDIIMNARADDVGSGIERYEYKAGDGEWMAFDLADPPKFTEEQISHIVVRVWDVAGNVSEEKARDIVLDKTPPTASHTLTPGKDGKRNYSEFLGFKIKVHKKSDKYVVKSHISDKKAKQIRDKLAQQAKNVTNPRAGKKERDEVMLYNAMVMGEQNYYQIATEISIDLKPIQRNVMTILKNRLGTEKGNRLAKEYTKVKKKGKPATSKRSGRELTKIERIRYGKSKQLRWIKGSGEPIYPIGYVQHKNPMAKKRSVCPYTPEGRIGLHDNLRVNTKPLLELMRQPLYNGSAEYADNRLSLFSAQWGRCAVTGAEFTATSDIHCHHKKLKSNGGSDKYENLVLVLEPVHKLIHAQKPETIAHYLEVLNLNPAQLEKVNGLRKQAGILEIKSEPCKGTQNEIYNTYSLRQKG